MVIVGQNIDLLTLMITLPHEDKDIILPKCVRKNKYIIKPYLRRAVSRLRRAPYLRMALSHQGAPLLLILLD